MLKQNKLEDTLKGKSLILITGESCASCVSMHSIANNVAAKHNLDFINVEAVDQLDFCNKYKVVTVPTVLLLDKSILIASVHGYQPEEILDIYVEAKLENYLEKKEI